MSVQEPAHLNFPEFPMVVLEECAVQVVAARVRELPPVLACWDQRMARGVMVEYLGLLLVRPQKLADHIFWDLLYRLTGVFVL